MTRTDTVWQSAELAETYLNGVRGAIPLAKTQIELMLRVTAEFLPAGVDHFLDLGCGDGVLGEAFFRAYPAAQGVMGDFEPTMLEAAQLRLGIFPGRVHLAQVDYSTSAWVSTPEVAALAPYDLIISGFSIHHQTDANKRRVYRDVYELLRPGGVFLNLEHVASSSPAVGHLFNEYFIDALWAYHQPLGHYASREEVAKMFYHRPDKQANILAPVETHCQWLRQIGFEDVDCFFKIFELSLFGGRKPKKL